MRTFEIRTEFPAEKCTIFCEKGAFEQQEIPCSFVFTDTNVLALYEKKIRKKFPRTRIFAMDAGEEFKTPQTLCALLKEMTQAGLHRNDTLVCVGGGVVGDIGGLASALYMRGIDCVQVPTTLLAQVDSSVGGKTAVDFEGVKNLVGAFKQPFRVVVDCEFLTTLPAREIRCGIGEIVKHSALNGTLFDRLVANRAKLFDLDFLAEIVPDNLAIKADVVQRDPRETGLRKFLNVGHTTGHALELTGGMLSHGEYVLLGLLYEIEIAKKHLKCDEAYLRVLRNLAVKALGTVPESNAAEAAQLARLDKKNSASEKIMLAVPVAKGTCELLELPFAQYKRELKRIGDTLC